MKNVLKWYTGLAYETRFDAMNGAMKEVNEGDLKHIDPLTQIKGVEYLSNGLERWVFIITYVEIIS